MTALETSPDHRTAKGLRQFLDPEQHRATLRPRDQMTCAAID